MNWVNGVVGINGVGEPDAVVGVNGLVGVDGVVVTLFDVTLF